MDISNQIKTHAIILSLAVFMMVLVLILSILGYVFGKYYFSLIGALILVVCIILVIQARSKLNANVDKLVIQEMEMIHDEFRESGKTSEEAFRRD